MRSIEPRRNDAELAASAAILRSCVVVVVAVVGFGACGAPVPQAPPTYQVSGGFLRDSDGRALILRGANLSGMHKWKPYLDFHQPEDYRRLRDEWGMNSIRFLVTWAAIEPQRGVYDEAYLDEVVKRIGWARDAGLLVVLDMHQDLYGEGFTGGDGFPRWTCDAARYAAYRPRDPWFLGYLDENMIACVDGFWNSPDLRQRYAAAWRRVAERVDGGATVVGFDVINEPHWGSHEIASFEAEVLQPFYEDVVAEVRKVRPGWIAFLEPSSSRNLGISTGLGPFKARDVVYSPHSYDSGAESGMGFDAMRRAGVLRHIDQLAAEARALDAALWIGEYGAMAESPGTTAYMDAEYDGAATAAAGMTYWDYSRGGAYSMLASDGTIRATLADVLARPYPERVAGAPASWTWDEVTARFTFTYAPDRASRAATEIVLPARRYPGGWKVECGGCETEDRAARVRLLTPPPSDPAVVTISPR